mmetsp:Transcript_58479/g.163070  ORF Transcript_58479/g.163070 Transcript_58479/m.163070 type:complete len:503 (+) Transcript_58479:111-1619(+)
MSYEPLTHTPGTSEFAYVKKVGVIGGGVAGLQMARALVAHGFQVTVFEKAPKVGGVWRENYHSYGVQVPKQLYEFPDFPFDAVEWGDYPTGAETQMYVEAYAAHFKLGPHIRCGTPVLALNERKGQKGYIFDLGEAGSEEFDFAIIATGMYSQVANMPSWASSKGSFAGDVIHSSEYLDRSVASGRRVVVIGCGKSAIDIAVDASEVAREAPTLLFRSAHWCTPRLIAGLIPFQYIFLSRFGQALVTWYKGAWPAGAPCIHTVLSYLLFPLMWIAFRIVELLFKIQRGQWGSYAPKLDVVADFYGYAHVLDTTFLSKWRQAKLHGKKGAVQRLVKGGVETESGEVIDADVVVCATGWKKTYDYLPAGVQQALGVESDGLYLHRHCIPAKVRDISLVFCGSEVATISNISTYALHAEFICRMLEGSMALPSEPEMRGECETMRAWKRSWMPETPSRASLVLLHQTHYHDQLLRDMGLPPARKCCLSELFCPYQPTDYDGIMKQ